jgi:hypothetical protein
MHSRRTYIRRGQGRAGRAPFERGRSNASVPCACEPGPAASRTSYYPGLAVQRRRADDRRRCSHRQHHPGITGTILALPLSRAL